MSFNRKNNKKIEHMKDVMKGMLLFGVGAAVGATCVAWLMSDSGKKVRGEVRDLVSDALDKMKDCRDELKKQVEDALRAADTETAAEA
jgi:gas vesicle protein